MSNFIIKENINRLLKERNWKVSQLEKKLNVVRGVTHIINGITKNPSIDKLYSIAKAFNVEITELISEPSDIKNINILLFEDICEKLIKELKLVTPQTNISLDRLMLLIKENYEYCTKINLDHADTNHIKWLISYHYK